MALDSKKIEVYCYLIKTGKKTITDVPTEYQAEVTAKLPYIVIVDIARLEELENKYALLQQKTSDLNTNLGSFVDYVFDQLDW